MERTIIKTQGNTTRRLPTSAKLDIALIVETFLKPDLSLYIENYTIHRLDRPAETRGGGVAIAVRKLIQHRLFSHYKISIIGGSNN